MFKSNSKTNLNSMGFARPFIGKQKYNCAIDYIRVKIKHAILSPLIT